MILFMVVELVELEEKKNHEKNTERGSTERGKIIKGEVREEKYHAKLKRALLGW